VTKKPTDASSILSAARRAADVQRPQVEPPAVVETGTPAASEKRVNIALRAQTHKRLKLLSVQRDMTVQDLAEHLLQQVLEREGA
jgi:hypothetical protein